VRRLISVDFPAPFGPMMEVRTPGSNERSRSRAVQTIPKWFDSFSVVSRGSPIAGYPSPGAAAFRNRADRVPVTPPRNPMMITRRTIPNPSIQFSVNRWMISRIAM